MPSTTSPKNYLIGGLALVAFPAVLLFAIHINGAALPMPWPILLGLFFFYGLRAVIVSLFRLDLDSVVCWITDAVAAAGFAVFCLWIAWFEKQGWSGVWFLPDGWNQNIARVMFACGGLGCFLFAGRCLLKAYHVYRNVPDNGMGHNDGIALDDRSAD